MFPSRRITTMGGDVFRDEYSIAFDGSNDYIDLGDEFKSTLADAHSFSVWVKFVDGQPSGTNYIAGCRNSSGEDNFYIGLLSSGKVKWYLKGNNDTDSVESDTAFADGVSNWVHLVFTASMGESAGDTGKIYINGSEDKSASLSGITKTNWNAYDSGMNLVIAAYNNNTSVGGNLECNISDFAFYNKALSASEVMSIYNGRDPYNHKEGVASGNLAGWWRMGDGSLDRFDDNGLICDNATTPSFGANLVTNGDFADATSTDSSSSALAGWTNAGTHDSSNKFTIALGKCTMISDGTDVRLQQVILTSGKTYKYSIGIQSVSSGSLYLETGAGTAITGNLTTTGVKTGYFVADNNTLRVRRTSSVSSNVVFDNVIIQEVSGNSGVMINMTADDFTGETP